MRRVVFGGLASVALAVLASFAVAQPAAADIVDDGAPGLLTIDAERQSTLVAAPGETYDIAPARGHVRDLPMPPDERWKPAPKAPKTTKES